MKVVYQKPSDITEFDIDKYVSSLNKYEPIPKSEVEEKLSLYNYNVIHASVLVEVGLKLLKNEKNRAKYLKEHEDVFECGNFERLRRITGYLVGSLERWNDGKKSEEAARVKHNVNSSVNDNVRTVLLETQAVGHNISYTA